MRTVSSIDFLRRMVIFGVFFFSALAIATSGRDLNDAAFNVDMLASSTYSRILQFVGAWSIVFVALAILTVQFLVQRRSGSYSKHSRTFIFSFAFYGFVVPGLAGAFGSGGGFGLTLFFAPITVLALCLSTGFDVDRVINTLKVSSIFVLAVGFLMLLVNSNVVIEPYGISLIPGFPYRYWGVTPHPNTVGPIGVLLLLIELCFPSNRKYRSITIIALAVLSIIGSQSKTAWIAGFVALGFYLYRRFSFRKLLLCVFILLPLGVWVLFELPDMQKIEGLLISQEFGRGDFSGRVEIWRIAEEEWRNNILFGYGPSIWSADYRKLHGMNYAFHAHSQFYQSIGESGLVGFLGLFVYLSLFFLVILKLPIRYKNFAMPYYLFLIIRSVTEPTFRTAYVLSGDFMLHLPLILIVVGGMIASVRQTRVLPN